MFVREHLKGLPSVSVHKGLKEKGYVQRNMPDATNHTGSELTQYPVQLKMFFWSIFLDVSSNGVKLFSAQKKDYPVLYLYLSSECSCW